jgi:hypothetical protein
MQHRRVRGPGEHGQRLEWLQAAARQTCRQAKGYVQRTLGPAANPAALVGSKYKLRKRPPAPCGGRAGSRADGADVMDKRTISSDETVALSRAIDAATDRGDLDEAIRLASMPWEEVRRWLDAHGYPRRGGDDE